jgi:mRNA interferase RelE/StbE
LAYRIEYKSSVYHDLKQLDTGIAKRVMDELEDTLSGDPNRGEPLTGQYKGLFKLRVGDYRVIYSKTKDSILILRISRRSKAYR